ncbi:D-alanyl-D-alanine carboxypeptidase family protein [Streptomyces sp. JHA19]|uniref:D-alanyl-D-alanine carboxypeptidase family protein n=1 Tax=Streptomyces sp. JHA19 TaxID=1577588 RepID=UPI0006E38F78|nr:serine hydrolase [Streptomyces sp. JHA19]
MPEPQLRPRHGSLWRRPLLLSTGTLSLAGLLALGVVHLDGGDRAGTAGATARTPWAAELPWPREGQAAVRIDGVGDLGSHGPQTPVPIASVTKVMTAYVILRDHPLRGGDSGPGITVDRRAADESVSGVESTVPLERGQRLSERRLLELMLVPSGNNVARLLARWDAGSEEAFVKKMNRAAEALGMHRTTYTGASGFEPTTTSTAADQLKLARQVMRDKAFRAVVSQPRTTVPSTSRTLPNTNTLLDTPGVVGIKTGSSTPAGGALMWAVTVPDGRGREHLALGVVLHQRVGTSPQEGLIAVFDSSRALIEAVRHRMSATEAALAANAR